MESVTKELARTKTELDDLRKAGDAEVKKQVAIVSNSITKDLTNGFALKEMALQNTINLLNREIELQKSAVADLTHQNTRLTNQYADATVKVQQIAEKAVEASSRSSTIINTSNETQGQARKG